MKQQRLLLAIALAVAVLATVTGNPVARHARAVAAKTKTGGTASKAAVSGSKPALKAGKSAKSATKAAASESNPSTAKPAAETAATILTKVAGRFTGDNYMQTDNTALNKFLDSIVRTRMSADSKGKLTSGQAAQFADKVVEALGEATNTSPANQKKISKAVTKSLKTATLTVDEVIKVVGKSANLFGDKTEANSLLTVLQPLVEARITGGGAGQGAGLQGMTSMLQGLVGAMGEPQGFDLGSMFNLNAPRSNGVDLNQVVVNGNGAGERIELPSLGPQQGIGVGGMQGVGGLNGLGNGGGDAQLPKFEGQAFASFNMDKLKGLFEGPGAAPGGLNADSLEGLFKGKTKKGPNGMVAGEFDFNSLMNGFLQLSKGPGFG